MNNSNNNNLNKTTDGEKRSSVVFRKCIACGKVINRNELVRILFEHKTNQIIINPNSKQFGKSKYICPNEDCLKIAIKKKRLKFLNENQIIEIKNIITIK